MIFHSKNTDITVHLQGSLACISGLSRTLWGIMLPGFGVGWAGMLAVQEAVGGRTVSTGFGALDLTAVWPVRCMGGRGGGVVATEHTTKEKKKKKNRRHKQEILKIKDQQLQNTFLRQILKYSFAIVFWNLCLEVVFPPFTCLVELQEQVPELRRLRSLQEVWGSELQVEQSR